MLRKKWMAIDVLASALVLVLFGALVFSANAQETLRIAVISDNHDKIDQTSRITMIKLTRHRAVFRTSCIIPTFQRSTFWLMEETGASGMANASTKNQSSEE